MTIGFFGAGKMAEGILAAIPKKSDVILAEKVTARQVELVKKYGVEATDSPLAVAASAKLIFLAVKPQDVAAVAHAVRDALTDKQTLVSIVAGKSLKTLRQAFGKKVRLIRVMPNLALRVHAGMCAICADKSARPADIKAVQKLLAGAGETVVLPEKAFDAVTALSGSGPAYFAYMAAAMQEGGVALGLKPSVARLLAEQTMYGTAKFLKESQMDLETFIAGVATPGGTTAAGITELSNPLFKQIVSKTLKAVAQRAAELD